MRRVPLILLAAGLSASIGAAYAADVPGPVFKAAPAATPVPSWTGVYAGASLGGRFANSDWTTTAIAFGRGFGPLTVSPDPTTSTAGFNASTVRAGIFYGYNWQIGSSFVVGFESDLAWGNSRKAIAGIPGTYAAGNPAALFDSTTVKEGWDGSSRVRAGVLVTPGILLYATGGLATQSVSTTTTCSVAGPWCGLNRSETDSWTKLGWTAGGGLEARLWGNWLGRAEYRYSDFGTITNTVFPNTGDAVTYDLRVKTHTALLGLAYQLDTSPGTLIASAIDSEPAAPAAPIYKAAPAAVSSSWTGAYAGVSLGGRWSRTDWTTKSIGDGDEIVDPFAANASFNSASLTAGGYVGYLWQLSRHWVIGTEATLAWGNNSRTIAGIPGTFGPILGGIPLAPADSTSVRLGWDSTYLTRVGYLVIPNVLVYGTGGTAIQRISATANCSIGGPWCAGVANLTETDSWTKLGWTLGGGVEAAIASGWRARAEYRYADFGTITQTFFAPLTPQSVTADIRVRTHTALVGLAYAFGAPATPVVSKY